MDPVYLLIQINASFLHHLFYPINKAYLYKLHTTCENEYIFHNSIRSYDRKIELFHFKVLSHIIQSWVVKWNFFNLFLKKYFQNLRTDVVNFL